jgi:hypothetical protein
MMAVPEKPATTQIALATIVPFVVGLGAWKVTMVIGDRYAMDTCHLSWWDGAWRCSSPLPGSIKSYSVAEKRFFLSRLPS